MNFLFILYCVQTTAKDTALFDHLINIWEFNPGPVPGTCNLYFLVDFKFESPLYRQVIFLFHFWLLHIAVTKFFHFRMLRIGDFSFHFFLYILFGNQLLIEVRLLGKHLFLWPFWVG